MSISQHFRFGAIRTTLPADTLVLRNLTGEETLSRPFQYAAELSSPDVSVDFNAVVGRPVGIRLSVGDKGDRYIHGIVSRLVQVPGDGVGARYRAEIVPWLWLLSRTSDCRIHQWKTAVEIVEEVFRRYGFTDFQWRLSRSYRRLEYCVQYRETALNFVSRLLESEGVTYFFEHESDRHVLVMSDSPAGHGPREGYEEIAWHPYSRTVAEKERIRDWEVEKQLQPASYFHTEYNFTRPRSDLSAASRFPEVVPGHEWEVFEYPGDYDQLSDGEVYARIRAEELGAAQDLYRGESDAAGMLAGCTFRLRDHPRADQNGEYLLTRVGIEFDQSAYLSGEGEDGPLFRCRFSGVPAHRPFRPARVTPRPVIHGEQTAVVVGPPGKEIHVDDHARVKVHFFWDRHQQMDDSASCWLRVSQPWAGKGYGGMNIPRIGCEVIVSFLEGDPDRPIITGRVYNAATMPNPSNAGRDGKPGNSKPTGIAQAAAMTSLKSQSTPGGGGGNEITMNDTAGAEGLYVKAQRDEIHQVGNDREDSVGNDEKLKVTNNREREVGVNEKVKIGVNQEITVGVNQALTVGVCRTQTVGVAENILTGVLQTIVTGLVQLEAVGLMRAEAIGLIRYSLVGLDDSLTVGKNRTVKAGSNLVASSGKDTTFKVGKDFLVEAAANAGIKAGTMLVIECPDITLKGAGGFIRIDAGGVTIDGAKIKLNCAGASAGSLAAPATATGAGGAASGGSGGPSSGGAAPSGPPAGTPPSPVSEVLTQLGVPPNTAQILGELAGGTLPSSDAVMAAMPSLKEVVEAIPKELLPKPLGEVIGPLAGIATGSPAEVEKELEALRRKAVEEAKKRLKEEVKERMKEKEDAKKEPPPPAKAPAPSSTPSRLVAPPDSGGNTAIIKNPAPGGDDTIIIRRRSTGSPDGPANPPESTDTARIRRPSSESSQPDPKAPADTDGTKGSNTQRFRRSESGDERGQ